MQYLFKSFDGRAGGEWTVVSGLGVSTLCYNVLV